MDRKFPSKPACNSRGGHSRGRSQSRGGGNRNWRNETPVGFKRNENNNNVNDKRNSRHMGFKFLESLLEQPLENLLTKISNNKDFFEFLQTDLSPDFVVIIVKLLGRVCECDFSSIRLNTLQRSLSNIFLNRINFYISSLAFETKENKGRNSRFWKDPDCFWINFSKLCRTALREMPHTYSDTLSKILKMTNHSLTEIETNHDLHISDAIKDEFKSLIQMADTVVAQFEEKERKKTLAKAHGDEGEPPDDFRSISVYPNSNELVSDIKPFLRKNVVEGPYRDIEHYLDVQFRLLREDFVGPLREGIRSYLSNSKSHIQNVKVHHRVQFLHPVTETEHHCVLLQFSFNKNKKKDSFRYENSRRFMFGSLVCFTKNNFKSLIFGKIVNRKEEHLNNGELVIGFDFGEEISYNVDYIMVECSVYFEPYYQVLTVMQQITEDEFPMKNYIVDVDTTAVMPNYISDQTIYQIPTENPDVLKTWRPYLKANENFFNFNPSQNEAFIAALTRQFSVIQGPPGTGKTYVGLKIAETLLHNSKAWYKNTPILIICYTNHALDQFLEGLTKTTRQIVRIGGQSRNDNLKEYNLRNFSYKMGSAVYNSKATVQNCLSEIKTITNALDMIRRNNCIVNFHAFRPVIPKFDKSWINNATEDEMLKWLFDFESDYTNGMLSQDFDIQNETVPNKEIEDFTDEEVDENEVEGDFDDLLQSVNSENNRPLLCLNSLYRNIQSNQQSLNALRDTLAINEEKGEKNFEHVFRYLTLDTETNHLETMYQVAQQNLNKVREGVLSEDEANVLISQYIPRQNRWRLYFHWLQNYTEYLRQRHERLNSQFRVHYKVYTESKDLEDVNILRSKKIIGMTTTGAARLHSSLKMIKSPIVIVEEAAEVLEAHIVSALTKDCQQLILIGDHQQLKPSTSNYQIERFYNLGISLFERMILNKVECFTLNIQHRMRPEISALIAPSIYPNLEDHESVLNRPRIIGVEKCLYFIDHEYPEQAENIGTTKRNKHEVEFLIGLAKYLILNGYQPSQITILAAYLGQMFEFQKQKSYHSMLKQVKMTVLDNYQGEECDIILLSLVRNNADEKVGFLSIDNRVCVALSRARNGLYVMGNMAHLCKSSELWRTIKGTFVSQDAFGTSLALKCENHKKITMVSKGIDFLLVAEGGCDQKCGMLLACGHICQRLCHIEDENHSKYECHENCEKPLCESNPQHLCRKECYENCGPCTYQVTRQLNCNHEAIMDCHLDIDKYNCMVEVPVQLPCGHDTNKPCYMEPEKRRCPFKCDTRLECGHSCIQNCHVYMNPDHLNYKCPKPCEKPKIGCRNEGAEGHACKKQCHEECSKCEVNVRKSRTVCSHTFEVPCHLDVDTILCNRQCRKDLPCGHKCQMACSDECGPCEKKVEKLIPDCKHKQKVPCYKEPDRYQCSGKCPRILTCGHVCKLRCNQICDATKCSEMVDAAILAKCGHTVKRLPCFLKASHESGGIIPLEMYCTEPCKELLNCSPKNKHECTGTCSDCFQGRIHKRCGQKCGRILICNHECEVTCRETCKPCQKPCLYKCKHSKCKKRCGEPCQKCREKCGRKCQHQECRKPCGDICSVPPCEMPCRKKLECGHRCAGFCGDPCPPLCRICNKEELEEIFFGTESDEDSRFVLLNDCLHIVESSGMEMWLTKNDNEIKYKVCPKCKTTISKTERYGDYIKRSVADIMNVKHKQYGSIEEITMKRNDLHRRILSLKSALLERDTRFKKSFVLDLSGTSFMKCLDILDKRLYKDNIRGRAQRTNLTELNFIEMKISLLGDMQNILKQDSRKYPLVGRIERDVQGIKKQIDFILTNLLRVVDDITIPEVEDIKREINRLHRMIQLEIILSTSNVKIFKTSKPEVMKKIENISNTLYSINKYNVEVDLEMKELLEEINKELKTSLAITDAERKEIVLAMGLSQGHWYKCPNGHPYVITECGGAMQISTCNDCGARIGGTNHALLSSNSLASEMDGARHSAWPTGANMANYDFHDLFG